MIHWLEAHLMPCFFKTYLGINCPGCGMQRSFIMLLKGELIESIKMYPALLPTIIMLIYLSLHLIFKFKHGASILKLNFIFTTLLIIANYIFKNFYHG
jgi:hypothetical protein